MTSTVQKTKLKHYYATVKMTEPFRDYWLHPPTRSEVLEALASLIVLGELDNYFTVTHEKETKN